jgi:hypothetical protein
MQAGVRSQESEARRNLALASDSWAVRLCRAARVRGQKTEVGREWFAPRPSDS